MLTLLFLTASYLMAQPDRFGLPACAAAHEELVRGTAAVVCYNSSLKVAVWSAEELTPEKLIGAAERMKRFRPDPRVTGPSAQDSDYRGSGYVRGHMVPAADVAWSQAGMRESFYLTNAAPQNASLNAGKWRVLESRVRRLAQQWDSVVVFTGPVFCQQTATIGDGVAVPCRLYKVAVALSGDQLAMFAAVLPNDGNPPQALDSFALPVADVERMTGLDFFSQLPPEVQSRLELVAGLLP